jgi:hypothetical protein
VPGTQQELLGSTLSIWIPGNPNTAFPGLCPSFMSRSQVFAHLSYDPGRAGPGQS